MRSFTGRTQFSSYGIENEVAAITYETNILGMKGPRRVGVVIPGMTPDGTRVTLRTKENNDSILNRLKRNGERNNSIWNKLKYDSKERRKDPLINAARKPSYRGK